MPLTIRPVESQDREQLFQWANDIETRRNSYHSNPIDWESHCQWFETQLQQPTTKFYLFRYTDDDNKAVGVVHINRAIETVIGITLAPESRGYGLATQMLRLACQTYWLHNDEAITAYIKTENIHSLKAFKSADFIDLGYVEVQGHPSVRMQCYKHALHKGHVQIIAELSANHGHSLDIAVETIRAAKRAGADAIKLQTYTADTLTIDSNQPYFTEVLNGSLWEGRTLYELYQDAYTPWEWYKTLFTVAAEEGISCFSTPFDISSVDFLEQFNPPAYKIASFEIQDIPLIQYVASKGRPMILSTGIAELADIELAVETCRAVGNNDITLLQCTSAYPAPIEQSNLATIPDLKKRFHVKAGLSDHAPGIVAPITAVALGATVIEKHFILDKSIGGPDASFSLDEFEFTELVEAVRQAERAIGTVTYKLTDSVRKNRSFARSLFVVADIKAGEPFTVDNVRSIRPNYGLHPKYYPEVLGKIATTDLAKGTPLQFEHYIQA